jgi:hypothetical protein
MVVESEEPEGVIKSSPRSGIPGETGRRTAISN